MKALKPGKTKKCRNTECRQSFVPTKPMQAVCGPMCAAVFARKQRERKEAARARQERRETREVKEKQKRRADHLADTQKAFNAWVRERDYAEPCISCGRHHQGQYHAGHYRTVGGNPALRFEPDNCHKQCAPCNNHKSGNVVEYRIRLVAKLGAERVEWLEGPHKPKLYSVDELKAMTRFYRAETRRMRREREGGEASGQARA